MWEDSTRLTAAAALDDRRVPERPFVVGGRMMFAWLQRTNARGVFGGQALLGSSKCARYPEVQAETVAGAIARGAL